MPGNELRTRRSSAESTNELIRKRAFAYYKQRGGEHGHDLDDWLKAEAEILEKQTGDSELLLFSFRHIATHQNS